MLHWHVEPARQSDAAQLASLVLAAAPSHLSMLFGDGDRELTLAYLTFAFDSDCGQFGFGNHWVIRKSDTAIATCCFWHDQLPHNFAQQTLTSLYRFFGLEHGMSILTRNTELDNNIARPTASQCVVGHISVASEYRQRGCAAALLNFATHYAKSKGKTELVVDVESDNHNAIKCYSALGFALMNPQEQLAYQRFIKAV